MPVAWRHTAEARKAAAKTIKGHRGKLRMACVCQCECGWQSSTWYGEGCRSNAADEFHTHKLNCLDAERK